MDRFKQYTDTDYSLVKLDDVPISVISSITDKKFSMYISIDIKFNFTDINFTNDLLSDKDKFSNHVLNNVHDTEIIDIIGMISEPEVEYNGTELDIIDLSICGKSKPLCFNDVVKLKENLSNTSKHSKITYKIYRIIDLI